MQTDKVDDSDYENALAFLYNRINYERLLTGTAHYPFRLQRFRELLRALNLADYLYPQEKNECESIAKQDRFRGGGQPERSVPSPTIPLVHIAGTKGKGSTAAMVAAILTSSGLKTGLYTSPHLHVLEERFCVDGQPCSRDGLVSLVQLLRPAAATIADSHGPPSFFELTTAIALLHFDTSHCDAIVLEVGLGGRLDSTNVCWPSVSVVTSIGLDHQHVLGKTLVEIAAEKAGILKPGVPVISGVTDPETAEVVAAKASAVNAPLYQLGRDFDFQQRPASDQPTGDWGSVLSYQGHRPPFRQTVQAIVAMEGQHQCRNAAIAIAVCDVLSDQGLPITTQASLDGLRELQCAARIERFLLPDRVVGIIDAAHNEDSVTALCDCLRNRSADQRICVVFGTSTDKAAGPMLKLLAEVADQIVLTRFFGNPRFQPPEQLRPMVPESLTSVTTVVEDPVKACESGLAALHQSDSTGGMLVVCGSFFLAAETRPWMMELVS